MKVLVLGAVAAGTKAAAKIKREDRSIDVKILTKDEDISYAGCGLPYYVGGMIPNRQDLIVNTPEKYSALTGVEVVTGALAVSVDAKSCVVEYLKDGVSLKESYDRLIIATGASAFVPDIEGKDLEGVFKVRTPSDAVGLRKYAERDDVGSAVVVGAGFIGLEIAENLLAKKLDVTVIDFANQIMPNAFDYEMAEWVRKKIVSRGIKVLVSTGIKAIRGNDKVEAVETSSSILKADLVVLAIGVRPNTSFLEKSGIEMSKGAILVDDCMRTNIEGIYAAGDCALVRNRFTGDRMYSAMGSTANISARVLAKNIAGKNASYQGAYGTGVVKVLDNLNAGRTGLTEAQAVSFGYEPVSVVAVTDDKAHYYAGASFFVTKLVADKKTKKLLGIQVAGSGAVDKMVDIAVTGLATGMRIDDFDTLDFAYAPPFSTAIHPFVQACNILENKILGEFETITPYEYLKNGAKGYQVIDALPEKTIAGAKWVDLTKVVDSIPGIAKDEKLLLVCAKGKRGYFLQNRLKAAGYTETRVLEGGLTVNDVKIDFGSLIPESEVKRVKGLGCLQDKRNPDHFNVRVITVNGKISSEQHKVIAEAAERFGSGEITMTTRLTLEIQGVPFSNIEPLREFIAKAGLQTGGTGSKVRPVVSCKGTTCQYGLIDTFALSEKIHRIFYEGWHDVSLPHKFKIAVGGCPNNCVKPDLNDLGIVGQRVILFNLDKCKGCKVCHVVNSCPVKVASVKDGRLRIEADGCNHCGRCASSCPFGVTSDWTMGYKIFIGGRWGKRVAMGKPLSKLLTKEEEVLDIIEKAILLFRDEGKTGERFADTVERLGFEHVEKKLFSTNLDKEKILKKEVVGGATC